VPHDVRDEVVDFIRYWSLQAEIPSRQLIGWSGISASKFYDWKRRYAMINEHNSWIPRDYWLCDWEKEEIISFHGKHSLEGYRRLCFMMLDEDVVAGRTYYYKLADEDYEGNMRYHGTVFAAAGVSVPTAYSLLPNYPNPFNPSTAIGYEISEAGPVALTIYNVLGQEVRSLVNAHREAGTYTVMWDSKDDAGHYLDSGVFFYTLRANDFTQTRKMVLMR